MPDLAIKICGLSTPEAIDAAAKSRATHIGLVHYEPSPRHVSLQAAAALRARVPEHMKVVLLLVNAYAAATVEALQAVKPDVVQFHGNETPGQLSQFRQQGNGLELWKAIGVSDSGSLAKAQEYRGVADMILFDAPAKKLPGGQGLAFDWSVLAGFRHEVPWGLAGGLAPGNVADAIRQTGAELVDTSSGVEISPGVKDMDKIAAFCQAARSL